MNLRALWPGSALVLVLIGCTSEPSTGLLTGKVLFDGQPVRSGSVQCVDAQSQQSNTTISPDGRYRLSKLAVGPARLAVTTHTRVPEGMRPPNPNEKPLVLPERYQTPDGSGLKVQVRRGETEYDIALSP